MGNLPSEDCLPVDPVGNVQFFALRVRNNRRTQLLFATGIERGIHYRQVLKYQQSVTSRVMFYHMIPLTIIEY